MGLEPAVTELGGGVNELEVDNLQRPLLGVGQQGLAEGQHPLLGPDSAGALEHQEVLLNLAVVGEAAHGVDGLVRQVVVGGGIDLDQLAVLHLVTLSDSVDLLVDLSSVMVTLLTSSGHSVLDPTGLGCQAPIHATFLRPL